MVITDYSKWYAAAVAFIFAVFDALAAFGVFTLSDPQRVAVNTVLTTAGAVALLLMPVLEHVKATQAKAQAAEERMQAKDIAAADARLATQTAMMQRLEAAQEAEERKPDAPGLH